MSEGQHPPAAATPPPPPVPTPSAEVPEVKQEPINPLNTDPNTWEGMLNTFIIWVAKDPWTFLGYVAAILTPLFLISAILSWKLSKTIEKKEKAAAAGPLRRSPRKKVSNRAKAD